MWFWIVLTAFFLTFFLVTWAVVRHRGDVHPRGVQHGHDVALSGGWGAGDGGGW
jgi:hypothetical protein